MNIVLNIFGVLIFFLVKLSHRKNKEQPLSIRYWLESNFEQLIDIALFDIALMMLVFQDGLHLNFEKIAPMLPEGLQLAGDGAMCFLVGLVFAWAVYNGYKKIIFKNE